MEAPSFAWRQVAGDVALGPGRRSFGAGGRWSRDRPDGGTSSDRRDRRWTLEGSVNITRRGANSGDLRPRRAVGDPLSGPPSGRSEPYRSARDRPGPHGSSVRASGYVRHGRRRAAPVPRRTGRSPAVRRPFAGHRRQALEGSVGQVASPASIARGEPSEPRPNAPVAARIADRGSPASSSTSSGPASRRTTAAATAARASSIQK
jgi:hypothetical protein